MWWLIVVIVVAVVVGVFVWWRQRNIKHTGDYDAKHGGEHGEK